MTVNYEFWTDIVVFKNSIYSVTILSAIQWADVPKINLF